ncbi:EpsG family protein [Leuconostoc citreum]|uniref:EpsG family protein n=1 Tax=Leuconostoc citreum TaxID=33964 RepID=UPI0020741E45|nr:EpsG family protein [Leuconostoc citreum]MCT3056096.1 EpsG family protein [Leuconostoc citreum]MCT3059890.1 EpsG family protein [Leuconostoc citreum]
MIISGITNIGAIKNVFAILVIILLALLSGTRYHLGGYDYSNYEYMFQLAPTLNNLNLISYVQENGLIGSDVGWTLINSITKSMGFNFYGLTVFVAIFFWFTLYFVLKKYMTNINIFFVIAMYKYLLDVSFIYMRQSVAVAIFILSLRYILKKKVIPYMLLVVFAATVHFSAVILIPIYWINRIKITQKRLFWYTVLFSSSFILVLLHVDIISMFGFLSNIVSGSGAQKISEASNGTLYGEVGILSSILHLIEFLIVAFFLIKNFDKMELYDEKKELMIKLFMLLLPIYSIFATSSIMVRYGFYFLFTYSVIIDYLVVKVNIINKIFWYVLLIIVSFLGMYKFVIGFDDGADLYYDSFIFHNESIRSNVNE